VASGTGAGAKVSIVVGAVWALLTVVIWSAWPAYTRLSVTTTLSAFDLVALRYAIGGLIFLPLLIHGGRSISPQGWGGGVVLGFFLGGARAIVVAGGLQVWP